MLAVGAQSEVSGVGESGQRFRRGSRAARPACQQQRLDVVPTPREAVLGLLQQNILIGGTLAILVLLLFLRHFAPTIVVSTAIPISIVGTFTIMRAMGSTLNTVSLAGIAFAVGMLVDNAIVVLENIDRHRRMGKTPAAASYDGAREV